jgi:hypothetical protein
VLKRHGFERIETGNLVVTYMRSKFEDTRRKALKFGANGSTVKAFKPKAEEAHAATAPIGRNQPACDPN